MSLTCMFFGHDPSHYIDSGREVAKKAGWTLVYFPNPHPVCRRCNAILEEKYYHDKLPEVIPDGAA